jgi:predicted alpha/beta-fold hydrolase
MKRELVTHPDGGTTALDWGDDDHSKALPKDAPILVLFHTITGSSEGTSYYYRAALKKGFRTVVFTRRGHGDLKLQTPKFNIMGDTSDAIAMMECVQKSYPECKWIGLVGISAGSGLMVSYLGQCGDNTPVKAGCSLCPAYDIEGALSNLKLKYPASDKYILNCAKSLWFGNAEKKARMRSFDEDATEKCLKATTLLDFVHCHYRFAGHATLSEYWKWHNPMSHYTGVKRPVLILNSDDDLVCVKENIREDLASEELNSLLIRTKYGSHVAYSEGWFGESNYMVRLSLDFMEACFVEDTTAGPELC